MNSNSQEIVQQIRNEFEAMITDMVQINPDQIPTASAIERNLWQKMLQFGRSLMEIALVSQAEALAPPNITIGENKHLPFHSVKERAYRSVFGEISLPRRYYYGQNAGAFPLDAAMNLPTEATSDMLQEWKEQLGAYIPYQHANDILENMLGQTFSNRNLQEAILADAQHVEEFYEQSDSRLPDPQATILVIQADGKGVPMVTDPKEAPARRSKGQKPCCKKEAIVTAVYTISPSPRTPQSVVDSHFHPDPKREKEDRPKPHQKWLWATLKGKDAALAFTAKQVSRQNGGHILSRVALTDGCEALQTRMQTHFPGFTLILDFIHADEYLWKAANSLLGETSSERTPWVEARTLQMLSGQTQSIVSELREIANRQDLSATTVKTLISVSGYFERNLPYMRYNEYLKAGWPIASGVIEGACRHLVKDRCELSGMRWTPEGAEALLRLRCVIENGDWAAFNTYRVKQRQAQVYSYWEPKEVETQKPPCLKMAA